MRDGKTYMTVGDMRKVLENFKDDDLIVLNVRQRNKVHGVLETKLIVNEVFSDWWNRYSDVIRIHDTLRIEVNLPDGAYLVNKNKS